MPSDLDSIPIDRIGVAELDLSISPTWTSSHTFQSGLTVTGDNLTIGSGANIKAGASKALITSGGGTDSWSIQDAANSNQSLLVAKEGGPVKVPSTGLTVSGSSTFQDYVQRPALSSDPADPPNDSHRVWQSDGTGTGSDGDVLVKITNSAGTTKTATLIDFSSV